MNSQERPRVSVVILAYNHERYIRETLEGAVNQITNFPFDIHIHDDASHDRTADIIEEYRERYPHLIKPIYQSENQFSKGVKLLQTHVYPRIRSEYVAFCEGDDYWIDPTKLQKQVDFLDDHPDYSLCCHDVEMKYEEGVEKKDVFYVKPSEDSFTFTFFDAVLHHFAASPTLMARRHVLTATPNTKNKVSGDIYLVLHCLSMGKGYFLADKMVVKRRNMGGITMNKEYKKGVLAGTYLLWKDVFVFTPKPFRGYIRFKMAEFQRALLKDRSKAPELSRIELMVSAIRNNPFWLLGLSEWYRQVLLRRAKRADALSR